MASHGQLDGVCESSVQCFPLLFSKVVVYRSNKCAYDMNTFNVSWQCLPWWGFSVRYFFLNVHIIYHHIKETHRKLKFCISLSCLFGSRCCSEVWGCVTLEHCWNVSCIFYVLAENASKCNWLIHLQFRELCESLKHVLMLINDCRPRRNYFLEVIRKLCIRVWVDLLKEKIPFRKYLVIFQGLKAGKRKEFLSVLLKCD